MLLTRLELLMLLAWLDLPRPVEHWRSLGRSVEHQRSLGLLELPSLFSSNEDGVNNGRSKDGGSRDREEDNHVPSETNEGRLDDDGGSNGVRLNVVPDAGETSVSSDGTIESFVESFIVKFLREQDVNWNSPETTFGNFNLKDALMNDPSFDALLNQKMNNVCVDLSRLLERNDKLRGSEEVKKYYSAICLNLRKRLEFKCRLSDRLLWKDKELNQPDRVQESLSNELESKKSRLFNGDEEWKGKIDPKFWPRRDYKYDSVKGLMRFERNEWRHLDQEAFKEFLGLGGAERFYNFFDAPFPDLFMDSYGAAYRFCKEEKEEKGEKEEKWFEDFR